MEARSLHQRFSLHDSVLVNRIVSRLRMVRPKRVEKITLVIERDTGRSRGFGFVEMTDASEADKAIAALNGTDLGGRTLNINEAKPKSDRPRSGGHRSGGGGGRGRDDYRGHPRQPREPRW